MSFRYDPTLPSAGQSASSRALAPRARPQTPEPELVSSLPSIDVVLESAEPVSAVPCVSAEVTDVLKPGQRAGEYVVGELIGHGGFGQVYEAVHPIIGKRAAVKVLSRQFCDNPELAKRFVNEARAVNTVRHKNVVDVFSFGRLDDGRLYFLMEMLEGETLQGYLERRSQLEVEEALHIFTAIAAALEATHAAGIVHRDLKPANVFLAVDGAGEITPKLLDFGVAKLLLASGLEVTGEGNVLGTPTYMAPEQTLGEEVSAAADVYSFGVMLHRALTGRLPFESQHALGMAVAHATQPPPTMSSVDPVLPPALDPVVLRMLSKEPSERPESPMQALAELERIARAEGLLSSSAPSELPRQLVASPRSAPVTLSVPRDSTRSARARGRALRRRARLRQLAVRPAKFAARRWTQLGMLIVCAVLACYWTWTRAHAG